MIYKWFITFILLCIGILLFASVTWFETQQAQIEQINQEHRDNIRDLQNIKHSNQWLHEVVIPYFSTIPATKHDAQLDMIQFYDKYARTYNFQVSKFLYYDTSAKIDIGFSFIPKNQNDIDRFLTLKYEHGFLQIQQFKLENGVISGILTLIQPMKGEANASEL